VSMTLIPGQATLAQLESIWRTGVAVTLHKSARSRVDAAHSVVTRQ